MKLVEPTLMDLLGLCYAAREDEIAQYESLVGPWDFEAAALAFYQRPGVKFGLMNNEGVVVCAGGWEEQIPGVWQSWMVGTDEFWKKYWRSITKQSRFIMDELLKNKDVRRLQTAALKTRAAACEWYERGLKMQYESTCKNFGFNGEDMVIYVRFKEPSNG
jgi:hypothetical protein